MSDLWTLSAAVHGESVDESITPKGNELLASSEARAEPTGFAEGTGSFKTICVCDAERFTAEGLRQLLQGTRDLRVVGSCESLEQVRELLQLWEPDLLVLDKTIGPDILVEWLEDWRRESEADFKSQQPAFVVWGNAVSDVEALRYVRAGAHGVLEKTSLINSLLSCFRAVASGQRWSMKAESTPHDDARLTSREKEAMFWILQGYSNRDIAKAMQITVGTVKIHLKHLFQKTRVRGRGHLIMERLSGREENSKGW